MNTEVAMTDEDLIKQDEHLVEQEQKATAQLDQLRHQVSELEAGIYGLRGARMQVAAQRQILANKKAAAEQPATPARGRKGKPAPKPGVAAVR